MNRDRLLLLNALALLLAAAALGGWSPSPSPACVAANACDATLFHQVGGALLRGDGAVYGSMVGLADAPGLPFAYPPTALPLFTLWGVGGARLTAALSAVLGTLALGLAARRLGGLAFSVAAMAGGWAFLSAWLGQTGSLMGAAALGLAVALQQQRRVLAGAFLALLLLKPQLGLFVALALVGEGAIVPLALAITAGLGLLSLALWGAQPWSDWLAVVVAGSRGAGPALDRGFMSTWHALVPDRLASSATLSIGMCGFGLLISAIAGRKMPAVAALGFALVAGALFAPHGHPYDLGVWLVPLFFLGRGPKGALALGLLAHLCVFTGVRAPLALASAWLLWAQLGKMRGVQRSG